IVPDALSNYVPVQTAAKELDTADGAVPVPAIQFEKDGTEDAGLVKIDLLGNRSLAVIRDAIAAAKEHEGVPIDYTAHDPEADGVRKALTKKRPMKELRAYEAQFREGAAARGVAPPVIEDVWQMILSFSGYSFCKGHSASYIQVALQSGYLRAHHPAEFIAGV